MQTAFRTINGTRVRYAERNRSGARAILLTSPWPESVRAFAPTWKALAEHAHLVAVDLPGFGTSERRDELLSPSAMGAFITRVIEAFGLKKPHVVAPDVPGADRDVPSPRSAPDPGLPPRLSRHTNHYERSSP